jgi:hypothetical protein
MAAAGAAFQKEFRVAPLDPLKCSDWTAIRSLRLDRPIEAPGYRVERARRRSVTLSIR